jgi:DNA recombination protein RmuC
MAELAKSQKFQLERMTSEIVKLSESNETKLESVRATVESKLQSMQVDNANQLELMRQTVDEKLQGALLESAIDEYGEENDDMAADQLGVMPS